MKKFNRWPVIIVLLLVTHIVLMLTAMTIATSDRSFAVVPNYYQEAVKWDQTKAAQTASNSLGWKVSLDIDANIDPKGERQVSVKVTDAAGAAVDVSKVELRYFHYAHGNDPRDITLLSHDGKISGSLPLRFEGFYEFIINATAGDKRFVEKVTQYVNAGVKQ